MGSSDTDHLNDTSRTFNFSVGACRELTLNRTSRGRRQEEIAQLRPERGAYQLCCRRKATLAADAAPSDYLMSRDLQCPHPLRDFRRRNLRCQRLALHEGHERRTRFHGVTITQFNQLARVAAFKHEVA